MTSIFISYSHKDEHFREELEVHLAMLKREGSIDVWHDRRIVAGSEIDSTIDIEIENSNIILLLVSPDFLASNYCYDVEVQRAMQLRSSGKCEVIPVILRPCDWQSASTPFSKLLAVPKDGFPITKWPNKDDAFLNIVSQLRIALGTLTVKASLKSLKDVNCSSDSFCKKTVEDENIDLGHNMFADEGWYCGHCNTYVLNGQLVCTGCHAEVAYEATNNEITNARLRGGVIGLFISGILTFGIPNFLSSSFDLAIPTGWGLGTYSLLIIGIFSMIGMLYSENLERSKYRNKAPRFFRHRRI